MNIRRLNISHASPYRSHMLEAYGLHQDAFTSTVAEKLDLPLSWWESRLAEGSTSPEVILGAFEDGRLAGSAGIAFEARTRVRHKATLFGVYVPVRFGHRGFGGALVRAAIAEARARDGVKVLQLTVTDGNQEAHALYGRCGFVTFGLEPRAVAHEQGFLSKIHMWFDLEEPAAAE